MKLHKTLTSGIPLTMQKALISTLSLAQQKEPVPIPYTMHESLTSGIPLKKVLITYELHGDTYKYYGNTFQINPKLFDKSYLYDSQIDVIRTLAPYLSPLDIIGKNNYYLYHKIRLDRAAEYVENARVAKEKKLAEELALNPSFQPEQDDVEPLGQEIAFVTHDW